ncbi:MAG: hypothetical protein FWH35_00020 [Treponema sp.]|nr:hypothetical protein [Treponema sp.]
MEGIELSVDFVTIYDRVDSTVILSLKFCIKNNLWDNAQFTCTDSNVVVLAHVPTNDFGSGLTDKLAFVLVKKAVEAF